MNILCRLGLHKRKIASAWSGKTKHWWYVGNKCERCGRVLGGKG